RESIDAVYENFSIPDIDEIKHILQDHSLEGLNVTIPHKESVLKYLDNPSDVVQEIQACNCIRIINGVLYGFNTDIIGFEKTFEKHLQSHHKKALVLGSGGASKAVCYILKKKGIQFTVVSRSNSPGGTTYEQLDESLMHDHHVIINTTPMGMYPQIESCPSLPYNLIGPGHYLYDLVYNPEMTVFLKKGKERGALIENGKDMLVIQAEESWKIWNS
ncbi:MAG: shikimate dehydrogenase family protein, partial [Chitinophagaceae bacterium]